MRSLQWECNSHMAYHGEFPCSLHVNSTRALLSRNRAMFSFFCYRPALYVCSYCTPYYGSAAQLWYPRSALLRFIPAICTKMVDYRPCLVTSVHWVLCFRCCWQRCVLLNELFNLLVYSTTRVEPFFSCCLPQQAVSPSSGGIRVIG